MAYIKRYEESLFLRKMHVSIHDLEPLAENCTKVWVWHTKTVSPKGIGKLKPIELTNRTKHTNLVEISKYRQEIAKSLWQGD